MRSSKPLKTATKRFFVVRYEKEGRWEIQNVDQGRKKLFYRLVGHACDPDKDLVSHQYPITTLPLKQNGILEVTSTIYKTLPWEPKRSNYKTILICCFGLSGVGKSQLLTRQGGSFLEILLKDKRVDTLRLLYTHAEQTGNDTFELKYFDQISPGSVKEGLQYVASKAVQKETERNKKSSRTYSLLEIFVNQQFRICLIDNMGEDKIEKAGQSVNSINIAIRSYLSNGTIPPKNQKMASVVYELYKKALDKYHPTLFVPLLIVSNRFGGTWMDIQKLDLYSLGGIKVEFDNRSVSPGRLGRSTHHGTFRTPEKSRRRESEPKANQRVEISLNSSQKRSYSLKVADMRKVVVLEQTITIETLMVILSKMNTMKSFTKQLATTFPLEIICNLPYLDKDYPKGAQEGQLLSIFYGKLQEEKCRQFCSMYRLAYTLQSPQEVSSTLKKPAGQAVDFTQRRYWGSIWAIKSANDLDWWSMMSSFSSSKARREQLQLVLQAMRDWLIAKAKYGFSETIKKNFGLLRKRAPNKESLFHMIQKRVEDQDQEALKKQKARQQAAQVVAVVGVAEGGQGAEEGAAEVVVAEAQE